jgi:dTDP-4-dehydrorhamnose reductase
LREVSDNRPVVAVLGAAGLLGHRIVADLRRSGHQVKTVGHEGRQGYDAEVDAAAATEPELASLLSQLGPPALIVNAIGVTRGDDSGDRAVGNMVAVNSLWPRKLAASAAVSKVPVVHISSDAVFADLAESVDEGSPPTPDDIYGQTKLLGEPEGEWAISLRCSFVGPDSVHRPGRGLWNWVTEQPEGAKISGFTDRLWTGVTSRQLATLIAQMTERDSFSKLRDESRVHHLCPNPTVTKYELVKTIARVLRPDIEVRPAESSSPVTRRLITRTGASALIAEDISAQWEDLVRDAAD